MTLHEIVLRLEELGERRAVLEANFPAELTRAQWWDDPEYSRICFEMTNLAQMAGSLRRHAGRKGGRKKGRK